MKFARFKYKNRIYGGIVKRNRIFLIKGNFFAKYSITNESVQVDKVKILAPVMPGKIVCVGLNYKKHADELKMRATGEPVIFMKPPTAIISDNDSIVRPESAGRVDYEAELAIIIKNKCKNLTPEQAADNIAGYTCLNDVTARDLQKLDKQWTRAKSFDTFCPIGPYISSDVNPLNADICLKKNGKIKQDSNTSDMIFNVFEITSFISSIMTLHPADVIATGTPSGVGELQRGDVVEVCIPGIGKLKNKVI